MKNRKTRTGVLLVCSLIFTLLFPVQMGAAEPVSSDSQAYVLLDAASGEPLVQSQADEKRAPASMTKIMTMLLAVEAMEAGTVAPTDMVTATETASGMGGSQIYLETGEQMTLHDLMIATAVESANDACAAIAEYVGGTMEDFVARMNERAQELGMESTHFVNCNGLPDEGHISTAHDMALLGLEAVKHSKMLEYSSIQEAELRNGKTKIVNTNKLLKNYEGADGLKTGWTTEAGNCLTATALRDGLRLICVVMGGTETDSQFKDAQSLLDYGFENYAYQNYFTKENICASIPVEKGSQDVIELIAAEDVGTSYKKELGDTLSYSLMTEPSVEAPVQEGTKLGEISIFVGGECQKTVPLVAASGVERGGFVRQFEKMLREVFLY